MSAEASAEILAFALNIRGIHKRQLDLLIEAAFYETAEEKEITRKTKYLRSASLEEAQSKIEALDVLEVALKEAVAAVEK